MKAYILVIVILPSTWGSGHERHVDFPTAHLCEQARQGLVIPEGRSGWSYCIPKGHETWYFPAFDPANQVPTDDPR